MSSCYIYEMRLNDMISRYCQVPTNTEHIQT